jgi:hypothetical protein
MTADKSKSISTPTLVRVCASAYGCASHLELVDSSGRDDDVKSARVIGVSGQRRSHAGVSTGNFDSRRTCPR